MGVVRLAHDLRLTRSHTLCRTIAGFWRVVEGLTVNLYQLSKVDFNTESILDGAKIGAMAICGHLDAIGEPSGQVMHEVVSGLRIPVANVPAGNELRFGINGDPRPDIAATATFFLCGDVGFLSSHEGPDFVALDTLAIQIAESFVLILRAGAA